MNTQTTKEKEDYQTVIKLYLICIQLYLKTHQPISPRQNLSRGVKSLPVCSKSKRDTAHAEKPK